MAEPITLAVVSAVVLTEGIKFLYGQAGEALKAWRERRKAGSALPPPEPVQVELPAEAFTGQLHDPRLHFTAVEALEEDLVALWTRAGPYAQGLKDVDPRDSELLRTTEGLRRAMEAIFGERLTFQGENAPPSGGRIDGETAVHEVHGYAAGLRLRGALPDGGTFRGRIDADTVAQGGTAIGADVDLTQPPGR